MTPYGLLQIAIYLFCIIILVKPLGWYIAQVYRGEFCGLNIIIAPFERFIYRICGIKPNHGMEWKEYLFSMLIFNLLGMLFMYTIQRLQAYLPLNTQAFPAVPPTLAFNTAASFVTNTDWQNYAGEATLSYLTQALALTVQNFLSAATGLCILIAFFRGLSRQEHRSLGNFWVDLTRGILYIFLPLAFIFAIFLSSQGVIQNIKPYQTIPLLQPLTYQQPKIDSTTRKVIQDSKGNPLLETKKLSTQIIPMGPVASQVAIKQLGSNGGGFFNSNSAHPFENPTPLTNFFEMLAILLIPAALCYTLGIMVNDKRQGWAIFIAMLIMLTPLIFITVNAEQNGNPLFTTLGISSNINMEGKETRFGIVNSALWTTATTATSNGSVNSMLGSFTPIGKLIPLWLMHLGEVVFGGVGSGLYGMLMLVIITVFIAGLMVGRSPEYLGKKIEPYEMKMASFGVLLMPLTVLVLTAIGCITTRGISSVTLRGPQGFSEIMYAFTSMGNNNGSALGGLNGNTPFYNIAGGLEMLLIRFWFAISVLAIAGSLVRKKIIPISLGTLPTHTPLFIILLIGVTFIMGALTFLPALTLGPIVEHLMLWGHYGR
jgi:K+-transporting ATPase ATPase A chain